MRDLGLAFTGLCVLSGIWAITDLIVGNFIGVVVDIVMLAVFASLAVFLGASGGGRSEDDGL